MILKYKHTRINKFLKSKLNYRYINLSDLIYFIFLIKEYILLLNIYSINIVKSIIYLLNLIAYKYILYFKYKLYHNYNVQYFDIYTIELYYFKSNKILKKKDINWNNIHQKILIIKKTSRTKTKGRIKRYKIIIIIGNKCTWLGVGKGKDYYIQDAVSKARINAFKNIYLINNSYSNLLDNLVCSHYKLKNIILCSSTYNILNSTNVLIRTLFDFIKIVNVKSKIIKHYNIYTLLSLILSL